MADKSDNGWTPERKARQREILMRNMREGKMGTPEHLAIAREKAAEARLNRQRKDRVAKRIVEFSQEYETFEKIRSALEDALVSKDMKIRLKAIELVTSIEKDEAKLQVREEEVEDKQRSREELIAALQQGPAAQIIRKQLEKHITEEVVEGEVID
jgi:hypothetical protein